MFWNIQRKKKKEYMTSFFIGNIILIIKQKHGTKQVSTYVTVKSNICVCGLVFTQAKEERLVHFEKRTMMTPEKPIEVDSNREVCTFTEMWFIELIQLP